MVDHTKLDDYESEIEELFEDAVTIDNLSDEMQIALDAASNTLKKDKRITIRLSRFDVEMIKKQAVNEGLPYQTLISSVLHKYATGQYDK